MNKIFCNIVLIVMAFVGSVIPANAHDSYLIHHFAPRGEMPKSQVNTILQDTKGYIWLGAQDGLYRYDANECRKVEIPVHNPGYLIINDLCEGRNNDIWIASSTGLLRFDSRSNKVVRQQCDNFDPSVLISKIIRFTDDSILCSAREHGAFLVDENTGECTRILLNKGDEEYFSSSLCRTDNGTVYLLVRGCGLYSLVQSDGNVAKLLTRQGNNPFIDYPSIDNVEYFGGSLIAGVADETFIYDLKLDKTYVKAWSDINDAVRMPDGTMALATSLGLIFVDGQFNVIRHYDESFSDKYALQDKSVRAICMDRENNLWVGTVHGGTYAFYKNTANINYFYPESPSRPISRRVRSIVEDPYGNIWIGSENGGLAKYNPRSGRIQKVELPIKTDNILALKVYKGFLWVGSYSFTDPLVRINLKTHQTETFPEFSKCTYHIEEYKDDVLMLNNRSGISFIDLTGARPREFFIPQLNNIRTGPIKKAPDASLWTGGRNSALFNIKDATIRQVSDFFKGDHETLDIISRQGVTPLLFDSRGRLWVTMLNRGIACLDIQNQKARTYTSFGESENPIFYAATEDNDGDIWITSTEGIIVLDPDGTGATIFNGEDGLMDGRFREFSLYLASDGTMYAGLHDGMISFNHLDFKTHDGRTPLIVVTSAHVMDNLGGEATFVNMDKERTVFRHNQNSLRIGVSDMIYSQPAKSRLMYKVDELNDVWSVVDDGKITLTGLSRGTYILRVRSVRTDGSFCDNEIVRKIVIKPHPLLSAAAIIIYAIILAVSLLLIVTFTRKKILRTAWEQARREREQFEVQRQKQYYTSKVEFLMNIAHEIRTPLTLIKGPIDDLIQRYSSSSNKELLSELHVVGRNSDKLSQLLDELLDFKKINSTGYELKVGDYNVNDLVQMVFDRFSRIAKNRNIDYKLVMPEQSLSCRVDKIAMDKILSNLLANAMKYSSSQVRLTLSIQEEVFQVILENDGTIVPLPSRDRIFKPFERFVDSSSIETGTGIGLYVSRNFAELLNGTLEMDNDTDVNRFILTIPIVTISPDSREQAVQLPHLDIPQSRRTILLVEDGDDMREFITKQLSPIYHLVAARNGAEALDLIKRSPNSLPEIIISDAMMPQMDGFELCKEIKKNPATKHITFIMLSALADETSKLQGLKYGADAYMSKPFSIKELLAVVQNQLSLRDALLEAGSANSEDKEQGTHEHNLKIVKIVDEYIQEHLSDEDLNVDKLAAVACVSVSSLFKKMKATIGISPNEFITISRLKKAVELLKDDNLSIEQVSIMVGFRSHAYFSTCFKKQFGVSPTKYRETIDKNN